MGGAGGSSGAGRTRDAGTTRDAGPGRSPGDGSNGTAGLGKGGSLDGGRSPSNGSGGAQDGGEAGPAPTTAPLLGEFTVVMTRPISAENDEPAIEPYTTFSGQVYDGRYPSSVTWVSVLESNGCQVLAKALVDCNPDCGGMAVCVSHDVCLPYPNSLSVGTVTVSGLGPTFTARSVHNNYLGGTTLPYPPNAVGDPITVTASGVADGIEAFTLHGMGITQLEPRLTGSVIQDGQPLSITWEAAPVGSPSVVQIQLDVGHHGGAAAKVACEAPDMGQFTIPAAIISKLLTYGVAGYPYILVTRASISETAVSLGRIRLTVSSPVELPLTVNGVTSCSADADCPAGQMCQSSLTCG